MIHSDFLKPIELDDKIHQVVDFSMLEEREGIDVNALPFSARVILENLLRNLNTSYVDSTHIQSFIDFYLNDNRDLTSLIPFFPSRVLMQDFTGVPAVVDLAAMRDAMKEKGFDPEKINPSIPVDLVIDHSVQVDHCKSDDAFSLNVKKEYQRNNERYSLLKWAAKSFKNFRVVPPGSGICHQVNLEYFAKVVCTNTKDKLAAFPDTLIGTDSHTTMINGLGVLGWGVGGIEAEAVMLGEPYYMKLPEIIGVKLTGSPSKNITATDIVLMITERLRSENVVEKIVEYTGTGVKNLSLTDRATIANMSPEYGATAGYFPIDSETISYLRKTSRNKLAGMVESYYKNCNLFSSNTQIDFDKINFKKSIEIDLSTIKLAITGPSKPNQRIVLEDIKSRSVHDENFKNEKVLIAALTSCTNTSNPSVMIRAGLVAQNAVKKGLMVPDYVKTSLSPGSKVVIDYLENANLMDSLKKLGFNNTGFGCMTCIGNSGQLEPDVIEKMKNENLNTASVLSGNRNFEARIHQLIKNNYLMSPALVVVFAIAGKIDIDFETEPVGYGTDDQPVYFKDLWPEADEVEQYVEKFVQPDLFKEAYSTIFEGGEIWDSLNLKKSNTFSWDENSLYIKKPSFFNEEKNSDDEISNARALVILGDTITTDHISPAGEIPVDYPAGQYLSGNSIKPNDFNTYGSRRGNHEIMMRGTFGNIRINNLLVSKNGGFTKKFPENEDRFIFDAAMEYKEHATPLIVLAGTEYGTGSSRDWAAKGTKLLGVKAVIASSFERIHRNNLIGMGVLPLSFKTGQNFESLKLKGDELFSIYGLSKMTPGAIIKVEAVNQKGDTISFETISRLDTKMELTYYQNGGILNFVLNRKISQQ
jgi:aconitate hydratase A / 2-methylisocitrate dehydratase